MSERECLRESKDTRPYRIAMREEGERESARTRVGQRPRRRAAATEEADPLPGRLSERERQRQRYPHRVLRRGRAMAPSSAVSAAAAAASRASRVERAEYSVQSRACRVERAE